MEIYVDGELPKNCFECPCFRNNIVQCCGLDDEHKDYFLDEIDGGECPLHSLADHDAELLKNAIVPKFKSNDVAWRIHWYTKKIERVVIVNTEIQIIAGTRILYLIAILEDGITLDNLDKEFFKNVIIYTDQVEESELFATREEAEAKLKWIQGEK